MRVKCLAFLQVLESDERHVFEEGQEYELGGALSLRCLEEHGDHFAVVLPDSEPLLPLENEGHGPDPQPLDDDGRPITAEAAQSAAKQIEEQTRADEEAAGLTRRKRGG